MRPVLERLARESYQVGALCGTQSSCEVRVIRLDSSRSPDRLPDQSFWRDGPPIVSWDGRAVVARGLCALMPQRAHLFDSPAVIGFGAALFGGLLVIIGQWATARLD